MVGVVLGSDSDLPVAEGVVEVLESLEVPYELVIASAHRTPDRVREYAVSAADRGIKVIIALAGGAAHLPGVLAALSLCPVIGVPVGSGALKGVDALYSMVQMPPGVPVGVMAIDGSRNAALYAARILALTDAEVKARLKSYTEDMAKNVEAKSEQLSRLGLRKYKEAVAEQG